MLLFRNGGIDFRPMKNVLIRLRAQHQPDMRILGDRGCEIACGGFAQKGTKTLGITFRASYSGLLPTKRLVGPVCGVPARQRDAWERSRSRPCR